MSHFIRDTVIHHPVINSFSPSAFRRKQTPGATWQSCLARSFWALTNSPRSTRFEPRGDRILESMIQEGKLRLTESDAVRLALESNVDINVERYGPYFSLWDVEKGRGVLNPSILFNTNVNRLVTPSTSVLQGGDTVLDLNSLYELAIRKPFEKGLGPRFQLQQPQRPGVPAFSRA